MKRIDFTKSDYEHKLELTEFLDSFNAIVSKYNKSFSNLGDELTKIEHNLKKKNDQLNRTVQNIENLRIKHTELLDLKSSTKREIADLEKSKSLIDYADNDVKKLEFDDINSLIVTKNNKVNKIETKVKETNDRINDNENLVKGIKQEIKNLEQSIVHKKKNDYITKAILNLINTSSETFADSILEVLNSEFVDPERKEENKKEKKKDEVKAPELTKTIETVKSESELVKNVEIVNTETSEEDVIEDNEVIEEDFDADIKDLRDDFLDDSSENETSEEIMTTDEDCEILEEADLNINDLDNKVDENPTIIIEPIEPNNVILEDIDNLNITDMQEETTDFINTNFDIPVVKIEEKSEIEEKEINADFNSILENIFDKEVINFTDFDSEDKQHMLDNADRVIKNIVVLKKHQIPLELTIKAAGIYYNIDPQDLDDLFNIITTDDEGNGMGFTIDYTFYILNELSKIDVDKLIEVYNEEYMNVNAKSGIIFLLKKVSSSLGEFKDNKNINIDTLISLGVKTNDEIEKDYPEFVNLDNPLFLNVLNLFDKDDLVEKLNDDTKIVPKILEFWKNN